jgi:hypothetical protein
MKWNMVSESSAFEKREFDCSTKLFISPRASDEAGAGDTAKEVYDDSEA